MFLIININIKININNSVSININTKNNNNNNNYFNYCVGLLIVNCPTRQSLSLFIGSPYCYLVGGGDLKHDKEMKILSTTCGGQEWTNCVHFSANITNYVSLDGEFHFCHNIFGVSRPQMHAFWYSWILSDDRLTPQSWLENRPLHTNQQTK